VKTPPGGLRSLQDLDTLKKTLAAQRRDAEAQAQRQHEEAARQWREHNLFATTVGPVQALRRPQRSVAPPRPRPSAVPRQRERDEAQVLIDSISDEFDVESLLETDDSLSFRRRDIGPEVVRKLRRGVWAVQAQLDLHGLRRDQARERLGAFLREAERAGLRCVRVIHGKGNGSPGRQSVLAGKVRSWLVQREQVIAFAQARASDGGRGALMVLLRP